MLGETDRDELVRGSVTTVASPGEAVMSRLA